MDFDSWLDMPIYKNSGIHMAPRREMIAWFVYEGLYPWIEAQGWTWGVQPKELANQIATGLWQNEGVHCFRSNWRFPIANSLQSEFYYEYYLQTVDDSAWEAFWSRWGLWEDVDPDTEYGMHRRNDIEALIWSQLNAEGSKQVINLDNKLDEEDAFEEEQALRNPRLSTAVREDIYLRESAESGEYDGWRK
jgi:hypothetical protein